ncbi:flagellar associated protein [Pycnococcus provasolii]
MADAGDAGDLPPEPSSILAHSILLNFSASLKFLYKPVVVGAADADDDDVKEGVEAVKGTTDAKDVPESSSSPEEDSSSTHVSYRLHVSYLLFSTDDIANATTWEPLTDEPLVINPGSSSSDDDVSTSESSYEGHSSKLLENVDEDYVRNIVGTQEQHALNGTQPCTIAIKVTRTPADVDDPSSSEEFPSCTFTMDATPLLLGETNVKLTLSNGNPWEAADDDEVLPFPPRASPKLAEEVFGARCENAVFAVALTEPPAEPEAKDDGEEVTQAEPQPTTLLPLGLALHLNPVVVRPLAARFLPDLPATTEQLDGFCAPVSVTYALPLAPAASAAGYLKECRHVATVTTPWTGEDGPDEPRMRTALFGTADVYFTCDLDTHALYEGLRNHRVALEVHDRSKMEDPPIDLSWKTGGILPRQEGEELGGGEEEQEEEDLPPPPPADDAEKEGEGEENNHHEEEEEEEDEGDPAYGRSEFACTELVTSKLPGTHRLVLRQQIAPYTTVKGGLQVGQSFDWYSRPGRYGQCRSTLQIEIASAQPIVKMDEVPRPYERVAFIMQYDDTELLLALEQLVRSRNATTMGFEGTESYILQLLNTYKTGEEEERNDQLDILTGFHLIDGRIRIVVLEGLGAGAIRVPKPPVEGEAEGEDEASVPPAKEPSGEGEEEKPIEYDYVDGAMVDVYAIVSSFITRTDKRRHILMNPRIRYDRRLYVPLGLDLQRLKLREKLNRICANAHVFAGGMVRKLVLDSLKKIQKLRSVRFLRQVDRMNLLPTSEMLVYLYKKFGGALTKDDIFGTPLPELEEEEEEEEDEEEDEEAIAAAAAAAAAAGVPPPPPKPKRVSKKGSQSMTSLMRNPAYVAEVARRAAVRDVRDWETENIDAIDQLEDMVVPDIKRKWQEWNPIRTHLGSETLAKYGVDLESEEAQAAAEAEAEAAAQVYVPPTTYPHPSQFNWPAARDPIEFKSHPKRPTDGRIIELQEPWVENENHGKNVSRADALPEGKSKFHVIMPAPAILGKDPEYFKTVFISGDGLAAEMKADKEAAIADWKSKIVVADTVVRHPTKRWHTNQVDRQYPILQGKAVKKGFGGKCEQKRADSTIFIGDEFKDSELKNILLRADYPNNWIAEAPFRRQIARDKTDVQKEGWNQSWSNTTTKMKSR